VKCVWKVQQKCKIKFFCNGLIFILKKNSIYKTLVPQFSFCKRKDLGFNYECNQKDATIQVNLLFQVSSTCFGAMFSPIIRSN